MDTGSDFQLDPDKTVATKTNRCFGITIKEDNNPESTEPFTVRFSVTLVQAGVNIKTLSKVIVFIEPNHTQDSHKRL